MANVNKEFTYIEDVIDQDLVQDWTERLKALQQAGGITVQTHNRAVGDTVQKSQTLDIYNDVIYTKNNISNLQGIALRTYSGGTTTGGIMDADFLIGTIEKNIGLLEGGCVAFKAQCSTNKSSNCGGVKADKAANFSLNFSKFACAHNKAPNFTTNNAPNRSAFHASNCSTVFSSVRSTNDTYNYMHFHGSNTFFSAKKVHVHSSHNKTFHQSKSSNFVSVTKNSSKFSFFFSGHACTHNNSAFFTANKASNCEQVKADCSTDFNANYGSFFAANYKADASTCIVNHSVYSVEGIDFAHETGGE